MSRLISLLTMLFLLADFSVKGQTGTIAGQVYNRNEKKGFSSAIICLTGTKIITAADTNGNFRIDNLPIGTYSLKIFFPGCGDTIVNNLKINSDTTIQVYCVLPQPCQYDKSKNNKTCPICGKTDYVVPIVYDVPAGRLKTDKYYYGGHMQRDCHPHWYCKKDKYKF